MAYGTRKHTGNVNTTGLKSLDALGLDQRIERIDDERDTDDGLWAYTVDGFCIGDSGCHILHEDTVKQLMVSARRIRPCACVSCTGKEA